MLSMGGGVSVITNNGVIVSVTMCEDYKGVQKGDTLINMENKYIINSVFMNIDEYNSCGDKELITILVSPIRRRKELVFTIKKGN